MKLTKSTMMLVVAAAMTASLGFYTMVTPTPVEALVCNGDQTPCSLPQGHGLCNGNANGKNCDCTIAGAEYSEGEECQFSQ